MNISSFLAGISTISTLILTGISPAISNVVWQPVPGTEAPKEISPVPDSWYVGVNTINRKGDVINFDLNGAGEYVRYSANCRTGMMTRILIGHVDRNRIVETIRFHENYFPANHYQRLALNNACSQNYSELK